jgi:hypothetical protein
VKDLVKNPIGIIALFISLIYGFANLLLGATASSLTPDERHPLIMFIVLFPILVLGIYYLLVSRHHGKLYAPGDYKDDKSFLRTLTQEERRLKYEEEEQEAMPEASLALLHQETPPDGQPGTLPTEPPVSYTQRAADTGYDRRAIESLVVSKFESELNLRAERDVGVGDTDVSFDAFFHTGAKLTFLEVKSVRYPSTINMMLDRVLYRAVIADKFFNSNFKLILAVVQHFDQGEQKRFESIWRRKVERCPATVELRLLSLSDLGV